MWLMWSNDTLDLMSKPEIILEWNDAIKWIQFGNFVIVWQVHCIMLVDLWNNSAEDSFSKISLFYTMKILYIHPNKSKIKR